MHRSLHPPTMLNRQITMSRSPQVGTYLIASSRPNRLFFHAAMPEGAWEAVWETEFRRDNDDPAEGAWTLGSDKLRLFGADGELDPQSFVLVNKRRVILVNSLSP